jgi:hypothetical protein
MNKPILTSSEVVKKSIKNLAVKFAEKLALNPSVIESLSTGVIERINIFGTSKFGELNREQQGAFIGVAVTDYFHCAKKYHDRYINEQEFRLRVQHIVYNLLTQDK